MLFENIFEFNMKLYLHLCLNFSILQNVVHGCQTVQTIGGTDNPEVCIFPFTFEGQVFNECTTRKDPEKKHWCSVEVDMDGKHVKDKRRWGHCNTSCLLVTTQATIRTYTTPALFLAPMPLIMQPTETPVTGRTLTTLQMITTTTSKMIDLPITNQTKSMPKTLIKPTNSTKPSGLSEEEDDYAVYNEYDNVSNSESTTNLLLLTAATTMPTKPTSEGFTTKAVNQRSMTQPKPKAAKSTNRPNIDRSLTVTPIIRPAKTTTIKLKTTSKNSTVRPATVDQTNSTFKIRRKNNIKPAQAFRKTIMPAVVFKRITTRRPLRRISRRPLRRISRRPFIRLTATTLEPIQLNSQLEIVMNTTTVTPSSLSTSRNNRRVTHTPQQMSSTNNLRTSRSTIKPLIVASKKPFKTRAKKRSSLRPIVTAATTFSPFAGVNPSRVIMNQITENSNAKNNITIRYTPALLTSTVPTLSIAKSFNSKSSEITKNSQRSVQQENFYQQSATQALKIYNFFLQPLQYSAKN